MHGGNFDVRGLAVKQYGAILGMQKRRSKRRGAGTANTTRHSGAMQSIEPGISRFPDVQLHI